MIRRAAMTILATALLHGAAAAEDMPMRMGGSPADKAFMATMHKMDRGMAMTMTGDPDKDFAAMMIPHHQGAIDMAKVELQYGKDPMLRKLATDIVEAQAREIAQMKAWQAAAR